jgi:hypothetical protein
MKTAGSFRSRISLVGIAALATALLLGGLSAAQQPPSEPASTPDPSRVTLPTIAIPPARHDRPLDERTIYLFFFGAVVSMDDAAQKLEAEGKTEDADSLRSYHKRRAGLTDAEEAKIKQVAYDWNQIRRDQVTRAQAFLEANRAAHGPKATLTMYQMNSVYAGSDQIIDSHIAQLRELLGDSSFEKLDKYVRNYIQPNAGRALAGSSTQGNNGTHVVPSRVEKDGSAQ